MSENTMKILRSLTTILVCLAILFAFLISVIQIFGFQIYGVLTGSMEPAIPTGSLIYLREADPERLRIGDVITYSVSPNVMATHRIVDIIPDESTPSFVRFQTKGDANQEVDSALVEPRKIIGKVAFSIPHIGRIANYIQKPPGIYVAILFSVVMIIMVFLTDEATAKKLAKRSKTKAEKASEYGETTESVVPTPQGNGAAYQTHPASIQAGRTAQAMQSIPAVPITQPQQFQPRAYPMQYAAPSAAPVQQPMQRTRPQQAYPPPSYSQNRVPQYSPGANPSVILQQRAAPPVSPQGRSRRMPSAMPPGLQTSAYPYEASRPVCGNQAMPPNIPPSPQPACSFYPQSAAIPPAAQGERRRRRSVQTPNTKA